MSPLYFQLCDNSIFMPIIVSGFFPKVIFNFSVNIYNHEFYYTYAWLKSSVLPEHISSSFFNYILIIFRCLLLYLSFFQKYLQFFQLSYIILNFRWKPSVLSINISTSLFNYILIVFVCQSIYLSSLYLWNLLQKSSNFTVFL